MSDRVVEEEESDDEKLQEKEKKKTRMKVKEPMVSGLVQDKPNWFILLTATHWILKPHGPGLKDRKQRT